MLRELAIPSTYVLYVKQQASGFLAVDNCLLVEGIIKILSLNSSRLLESVNIDLFFLFYRFEDTVNIAK